MLEERNNNERLGSHLARAKLANRMMGTEEHTAINANYHEINDKKKAVRDQ